MANPENLRPPKKGEVRNPKGKPKGCRAFKTIFREFMEATQDRKNPVTGNVETLTIQQQIVLALIGRAMKGDVGAFREIADRLEGKVADKVIDETPVEKKVIRMRIGENEIELGG